MGSGTVLDDLYKNKGYEVLKRLHNLCYEDRSIWRRSKTKKRKRQKPVVLYSRLLQTDREDNLPAALSFKFWTVDTDVYPCFLATYSR